MTNDIPAWIDGRLQPVDKLDVHLRGLKHPAVSVFVVRKAEVLLQRRALEKYHTPGLWANTCCTHPLWGESAGDCAVRRLREELGITGLAPAFRDRVEYRADVGGGMTEHEVVDIFLADAPDDLDIAPAPEEVMETRWIGLDALARDVAMRPEGFTPWLRIYMAEHASKIFDRDMHGWPTSIGG